jgi:hypothetical protein
MVPQRPNAPTSGDIMPFLARVKHSISTMTHSATVDNRDREYYSLAKNFKIKILTLQQHEILRANTIRGLEINLTCICSFGLFKAATLRLY